MLRKLAPRGCAAPDILGEQELRLRIRELEEKVKLLTAQLGDSEKAREAVEALVAKSSFVEIYRIAAAKSLGNATGTMVTRLLTFSTVTAAVYPTFPKWPAV